MKNNRWSSKSSAATKRCKLGRYDTSKWFYNSIHEANWMKIKFRLAKQGSQWWMIQQIPEQQTIGKSLSLSWRIKTQLLMLMIPKQLHQYWLQPIAGVLSIKRPILHTVLFELNGTSWRTETKNFTSKRSAMEKFTPSRRRRRQTEQSWAAAGASQCGTGGGRWPTSRRQICYRLNPFFLSPLPVKLLMWFKANRAEECVLSVWPLKPAVCPPAGYPRTRMSPKSKVGEIACRTPKLHLLNHFSPYRLHFTKLAPKSFRWK